MSKIACSRQTTATIPFDQQKMNSFFIWVCILFLDFFWVTLYFTGLTLFLYINMCVFFLLLFRMYANFFNEEEKWNTYICIYHFIWIVQNYFWLYIHTTKNCTVVFLVRIDFFWTEISFKLHFLRSRYKAIYTAQHSTKV